MLALISQIKDLTENADSDLVMEFLANLKFT